MGSFTETIKTLPPKDTRCKLGVILADEFDSDDLKTFTNLVKARNLGVIHNVLNERVGRSCLTRHVQGLCGCPDKTPGKGIY